MANLVFIFTYQTCVPQMLAMVPAGLLLMEILLTYLSTISPPGLVHSVDVMVITKQLLHNEEFCYDLLARVMVLITLFC